MASKTIAVVGATGTQGGGLVRAILADPDKSFVARAVTRNPNSDKAKAIAAQGAQLATGDADDPASMAKAFAGADAAFCVTNFWEHFSADRELTQAKALADAAKAAGVKHVVWSTLEDTRRWVPLSDNRMPTLQGKYKVPHFDAKGEADNYFREIVPTTLLLTVFYWDNLMYMGPKPGPDGQLTLTYPMADKRLPSMAAEDIGPCAYEIFKIGPSAIGKTFGVSGGQPTGTEMAAAISKAIGKPVRFQDVPPEVYRGFGFPGADDLGNMFQFKRDFNDYYCKSRDVEASRKLFPRIQTLEAWLAKHGSRIPLG